MKRNLKVRVARISIRPNKNQSYVYRVIGKSVEQLKALAEDPEVELKGVYEGTEGDTLIYSRNRIGNLNQEITVDARIVERDETNYLNLVDNSMEAIGEAGYAYQQAQAFGEGFAAIVGNHAVAKLFAGQKPAAAAAPVRRERVEDAEEVDDTNLEDGAATDTDDAAETPQAQGAEPAAAGADAAAAGK